MPAATEILQPVDPKLPKETSPKNGRIIVNPGREAAVLGAGVMGLMTAYTLIGRGYSVTIYGAGEEVSRKAGASFKPHAVVYNNATHRLLLNSWGPYHDFSRDPNSGVVLKTHYEATDYPE